MGYLENDKKVTLLGINLDQNDIADSQECVVGKEWTAEYESGNKHLVMLDFRPDPVLEKKGMCREAANVVQRLRRDAGLSPGDPVDLLLKAEEPAWQEALKSQTSYLEARLRRAVKLVDGEIAAGETGEEADKRIRLERRVVAHTTSEESGGLQIWVCARQVWPVEPAFTEACGGDVKLSQIAADTLRSMGPAAVEAELATKGEVKLTLYPDGPPGRDENKGTTVTLRKNKELA